MNVRGIENPGPKCFYTKQTKVTKADGETANPREFTRIENIF